jgi:hypothetical protein
MRLALATAAALLALVLPAPADAARRIDRCKMPDRATVEAVGGRLVVWSLRHRDRDDDFFTHYHVCRRSTGKRFLLKETLEYLDYHTYARHVSVAGDYVGYVYADEVGNHGSYVEVIVYDTVRRRESEADIGGDFSSGAYMLPDVVPAFVLARTGVAAYVVRHPSDQDPYRRPREPVGVRVVEDGDSRLLDKGAGIDPASLRIDGAAVHWTNAGEARSAGLR